MFDIFYPAKPKLLILTFILCRPGCQVQDQVKDTTAKESSQGSIRQVERYFRSRSKAQIKDMVQESSR